MPAERIESRDRLLFTPGPLTTSAAVKSAMLHDLGSRDRDFLEVIRAVRRGLLEVAGVSQVQGYEVVPMQGSGTFGVEAVLSAAPAQGKWLIVSNGAYGERMVKMASVHRLAHRVLRCSEDSHPDPREVDRLLLEDSTITGVTVVHCETTSGILNPIEEIGKVVKSHGKTYVVDAMSSFAGIEFEMPDTGADFLISSANKCLEGVPGLCFVLARRTALEATAGQARSLSLDLYDQWRGLEETGQFRYTPPTHVILALAQALEELSAEGSVPGRAQRYRANRAALTEGMNRLGFVEYLPSELQGPIITSYRYPTDERFHFAAFSDRLHDLGFVIYPGKVSRADCFRIGTIGRLYPADVRALVTAIGHVVGEMMPPRVAEQGGPSRR